MEYGLYTVFLLRSNKAFSSCYFSNDTTPTMHNLETQFGLHIVTHCFFLYYCKSDESRRDILKYKSSYMQRDEKYHKNSCNVR